MFGISLAEKNHTEYKDCAGQINLQFWLKVTFTLSKLYVKIWNNIVNSTQATNINLLRKTDKINLSTTANCNFLTIEHNAICSIYDSQNNATTWYIYG